MVDAIHSLAALAECRDNETGNHIRRTQKYLVLLAQWYKEKIGTELVIGFMEINQAFREIALSFADSDEQREALN